MFTITQFSQNAPTDFLKESDLIEAMLAHCREQAHFYSVLAASYRQQAKALAAERQALAAAVELPA